MNIQEIFREHFNGEAEFGVLSPGRVNLIGEHVDYNDGFVLPMAVPLHTDMVLRARDDDKIVLHSPLFGDTLEFSVQHLQKQGTWIDYAQAVAAEFVGRGIALHGFEGVVMSNVPLASGLSSSASFEVAVAMAFLHLAGESMTPSEVALLCQHAENNFIGVQCGIMDQMAVAACTQNHALLLDCRTLEMRQVPFRLPNHAVIVIDSAAPRELASSAYNTRRAECELGLSLLQKHYPDAQSLRDISPDQFALHSQDLPQEVAKRLAHVIGEIARTQEAVEALENGNLETFGAKMNESHASLRDLYEVTSAELDFLTDWARKQPGVLGSRMTGAGFGGCTVTLIERAHAPEFLENLIPAYEIASNRVARGWICEAAAGAAIV